MDKALFKVALMFWSGNDPDKLTNCTNSSLFLQKFLNPSHWMTDAVSNGILHT